MKKEEMQKVYTDILEKIINGEKDIKNYILNEYEWFDVLEDDFNQIIKHEDPIFGAVYIFVFTNSYDECVNKALEYEFDMNGVTVLANELSKFYYIM